MSIRSRLRKLAEWWRSTPLDPASIRLPVHATFAYAPDLEARVLAARAAIVDAGAQIDQPVRRLIESQPEGFIRPVDVPEDYPIG